MDERTVRYWSNAIYDAIHNSGKTVYLSYHQSSACSYCILDPVSGVGRFNCSTCHGTGVWTVSTTIGIKAVVNRFLGNVGFIKFGNEKYSLTSDGQARITIWLPDVSYNPYSHTSRTYLDSADSIRINSENYGVKDFQRVGAGEEDKVCVVTLERK